MLSPKPLVNKMAWADAKPENFVGSDSKAANSQADTPIPDAAPIRPLGGTLLGTREDLSSREREPLPTWGRWASPCHWRCQRCTDRLGFLLVGQVLAALPTVGGESPRPEIGSLTISPPPGIKLGEIRHAVERLLVEQGGHSIWSLKIAYTGRIFAYALTTAHDPKNLQRLCGARVLGDSRSARFNQVRGSMGCWSPPDQAFALHIGRVLRNLVQRAPFAPHTLRPGYRFGANGLFGPLLTNALAILRREHPCQAVGHHRTREQAGKISPDAPDGELRTCRWCDLAVFGRAWRHPHCSTRRWRANLAVRSELGPADFDAFLYQVAELVHVGLGEPEAMQQAFVEFAGRDASLPPGLVEVLSLPREIVPPGRRPARSLRLPKAPRRRARP